MKKSDLFVLRWFPASIYISEPEMERHIYSPHSISTEYSFNLFKVQHMYTCNFFPEKMWVFYEIFSLE